MTKRRQKPFGTFWHDDVIGLYATRSSCFVCGRTPCAAVVSDGKMSSSHFANQMCTLGAETLNNEKQFSVSTENDSIPWLMHFIFLFIRLFLSLCVCVHVCVYVVCGACAIRYLWKCIICVCVWWGWSCICFINMNYYLSVCYACILWWCTERHWSSAIFCILVTLVAGLSVDMIKSWLALYRRWLRLNSCWLTVLLTLIKVLLLIDVLFLPLIWYLPNAWFCYLTDWLLCVHSYLVHTFLSLTEHSA